MVLKKQAFKEGEIPIFDEAVVYKRKEYWQFRMWLAKENKYARKSLGTRNQSTAIERGKEFYLELLANQKAGKTYFSLTTKEGVEKYLKYREKHLEIGNIVVGRFGTIKTHLDHWLDFIKKDVKLKELQRTDCEDYFYKRRTSNKKNPISPQTIANEQSTINAMMRYLFKHNETMIDEFDFPPIPKHEKNAEDLRRESFLPEEINPIVKSLYKYIDEGKEDLTNPHNLNKVIAGYYFLIAMHSGLRTGEQRQLTWGDVKLDWLNPKPEPKTKRKNKTTKPNLKEPDEAILVSLATISVRKETSKVRKPRRFKIKDDDCFTELGKVVMPLQSRPYADKLIFSANGTSPISERAILFHFDKILTMAEIKNRSKRRLVPYSFRHFYITERIKSGRTYSQIADACGTSVTQIENVYYHPDDQTMTTHALADYTVNVNGVITQI